MVLRKPYALLIKNFKLIHVVCAALALVVFLKCNDLIGFFNDYIENTGFILEDFRIKELFPIYVIIIILFLIILNIVIAALLKIKDKGITFYIISTTAYIVTFAFLMYVYSLLNTMQIRIVDVRTVRALRDIFMMVNGIQIVSFFMYGFRATGFDVKKFNFTQDLIELEIEEKDNEEVEVSVDIDVNKLHRQRRRSFRMLRYFYLENRLISNIILSVIVILLLAFIGIRTFSKNPTYKQFQLIQDENYSFMIQDVYITNKDKNNSIVDKEKAFVIIEVKAKKKGNKTVKLNLGRFELKTKNFTYFHNSFYKDIFSDFGTIYTNQELSGDFQRFFLIYRIPSVDINEKLFINYVGSNGDNTVNFNVINMQQDENKDAILGETVILKDTILNDYELILNKFEIGKNIEVKYKYCLTEKDCINAKEYVNPTISTNYDKAVLRIDGSLKAPEEFNSYATNMEMLVTKFGYLKYVINDKVYTMRLNLGTLKANKVKQDNTTYFEIKREVLVAEEVSLIIKIRNKSYQFILKESV